MLKDQIATLVDDYKKYSFSSKFTNDVLWNILSFFIMAISGIFINIIIAYFYGPNILGIFNQVYSIYVILSQFTVCGVHLSVLRYIAEFSNDAEKSFSILVTATILTALIALVVCFTLLVLRRPIASLLQSEGVGWGLLYILPGLWFFSINKVWLAALNGWGKMKTFAFYQSFRYILIVLVITLCSFGQMIGYLLPVAFTGAEFLVFITLLIYLKKHHPLMVIQDKKLWLKRHIEFALKAFIGGTLNEIHTRMDIIMLGIFANDRLVGLYSFASIFAEGLIQLMVVIRANVNPILTRLYTQKSLDKLSSTIRRGITIFYPLMGLLCSIAIASFPLFTNIFLKGSSFAESWYIFIILAIGIILSGGYYPFNMLLNQAGFAGYQTWLVSLSVLTNILLNLVFIPHFGPYGAALATAISFALSVYYLKMLSYKIIGIKI